MEWWLTSNTVIFLCTLGVTLDRTLSYKQHIEKVKGKVRTRNNFLHKLANSSWGANTFTLRATALALCYSVAEYACPVWERSSHAKKVDASLNDSCRCITGCLRPTNVDSLYVLAGIAPPGVRISVASRTERRSKLMTLAIPVITTNQPQAAWNQGRASFMQSSTVTASSNSKASIVGGTTNCKSTPSKAANPTSEQLAPGHKSEWKLWKSLNRLRTGIGPQQNQLE